MASEVFLGLSLVLSLQHNMDGIPFSLSCPLQSSDRQALCVAGVSVCSIEWLQVLDPIEWGKVGGPG